jgi:hypothetical protein
MPCLRDPHTSAQGEFDEQVHHFGHVTVRGRETDAERFGETTTCS